MRRALLAGADYFVCLFALGFALGAVRVLVLAPRVGALAATMIEAPSMLIAAWFACRWIISSMQVANSVIARWTMALSFFALLTAFEIGLGAAMFGRSPAQQLEEVLTPAGLLGLAAQIVAALLPVFLRRRHGAIA